MVTSWVTLCACCWVKTFQTSKFALLTLIYCDVLEKVISAQVLTKICRQVKVRISFGTLPGFHVENCGSHFGKSTITNNHFGFDNLHPERIVYGGKKPLILKPASTIDTGEIGDSHDKIVDKLFGKRQESSSAISFPELKYYNIFFGALYVVWIENNLWKMQFLNLNLNW